MTKRMGRIEGLYAVTPDEPDTTLLADQVVQALEGGAQVLQYRNKSADAQLQYRQAQILLPLCRRFDVPLIINDSVKLALSVGADGVHIGANDGSIVNARQQLGTGKILGISCYNQLSQALGAARQGADYVAFGSFFSSSIKPYAVSADVALLRNARKQLSLPIVAIGGITLSNAGDLITNGANAIAVISALFTTPDVKHSAVQFAQLFNVHH